MLDNLNRDEAKLYQYVSRYSSAFSEEELVDFENSIFSDYSYRARVISEFKRLNNFCKVNSRLYSENLREIVDIERLIKISSFDQTLVSKIADMLVKVQVKVSQPVRLYSSCPRIAKELERKNLIREKSISRKIGR